MTAAPLPTLLRDNPVVVTGLGCLSAAGGTVDALWDAAASGRSLAAWREFEVAGGLSRFAVCSAPELDPSRPELRALRKADRCVQMAWLAASDACHQAQLTGAYPPARLGLVVGSSRGPIGRVQESLARLGQPRHLPSLAAHSTFAALSGALAQGFGFKGPVMTLSATCASAAFALGYAAEQILLGKADAMIAGGAEAPLQPVVLAQLQAAGVLGFHADAARTCRPFDATRNGMVLGEGSAFLVLESARAAAHRGVRPLAQLAGWAAELDDAGRTELHADGSGLLRVMQHALQCAGLEPGRIDYINAHGSGTKLNDLVEARAVEALFGDRAARLPCSSTKPVTGHCLGATAAL